MANPQTENGYTRIANEILDAVMRIDLSGGERRTLDAIIRKTYGFNKKQDNIAYSQLASMTGLSKRTVMLAVQNLEAKNILSLKRKDHAPASMGINKDHESWITEKVSKQVERRRQVAKLYGANLFTSERLYTGEQSSTKLVNSSVKTSEHAVHPQKTTKEIKTGEDLKKRISPSKIREIRKSLEARGIIKPNLFAV